MQNESNRKILGAFVVGVALVAGAYTIANFNKPEPITQQASIAVVDKAAPRMAISVTDNDQNGIEDWRDSFVTAEPVILNQGSSTYRVPTTLTDRLGVSFMENILRAKVYKGIGKTEEEVVQETARLLQQETSVKLFDVPDIIIMDNWTETDILNYGNAMGGAILNNSNGNTENELSILNDIVTRNNIERLAELESIAKAYKALLDDSLATPVPAILVKQHLDLINTYQAIQQDINAMTYTISDPVVSLMRLQRYEDDALGLVYAMQNMYTALSEHSGLFGPGDSALIFSNFNVDRQI